MDNRKSLILHFDSLDVIDELSNEQIAQLFKAIRDYNLWKEIKLDWLMKAVFIPFKNQFDRDLDDTTFVYFVELYNDKEHFLKIWITKDILNRMQYINSQSWYSYKVIKEIKCNSKKEALEIESYEHMIRKNKRYNPKEYFYWYTECFLLDSKDKEKKSTELSYWKNDINEMQEIIKDKVLSLWLIYKSWSQERNRIQNILTAKDFWMICEKASMSRIDFVLNIIELSTKLEFWKWKIYNAETLYKHYASVYNEAVRIKSERKKPRWC